MRSFDQASAKRYFIDAIITQAKLDQIPLSDAERYSLAWSESDPTFIQNTMLTEKFEQETTMQEYENKIEDIIKRAYKTVVTSAPDGKQTFREAYSVLNKGDHYILVMLRAALGMRLNAWWPF